MRTPFGVPLLVKLTMQFLLRLFTGFVFAAHAMLGCGAHRSCDHNTAVAISSAHHADHHCAANHEGHSAPHDDNHAPDPNCQHSNCSFVKAEKQQDLSAADFWSTLLPSHIVVVTDDYQLASEIDRPVFLADHSSTPLFVWHCALIL